MEKKNTGLKVTIVILIILVLGLGSFIIWDKVINKPVNDNSPVTNNNNESNVQAIDVETIDKIIKDYNTPKNNVDCENCDGVTDIDNLIYSYKIKSVNVNNNLIEVVYYSLYYGQHMGNPNSYYDRNRKLLNSYTNEYGIEELYDFGLGNLESIKLEDFVQVKYTYDKNKNEIVNKQILN